MIKIGTSGYSYSWNKGKPSPFGWYLSQGFKTVEINASFYRFPTKSWVKAWSAAPEDFDFAIKVHKSITHYSKLQGKALDLFARFSNSLEEVKNKISFWLFQMPENFGANKENVIALTSFFNKANPDHKAVIEFRHKSWWKLVKKIEALDIVFCSVDAPKLPREIIPSNDVVYLRLHGRKEWYSWIYTEEELGEIVNRILDVRASKKYIFFNNDHGMIPNSRFLMQALGV
jgi:uncharacterized protein YecE (DUF72 family)